MLAGGQMNARTEFSAWRKIGFIVFLWMAFGPIPRAHACKYIAAGNQHSQAKLDDEEAALSSLQLSVKSTETTCQAQESLLAQQGAKTATSESCVAFRENAALNKKLADASESCSSKIVALRVQIENLKNNFITPQQEDLADTVNLDGQLQTLAKTCGKEMAATKVLRGRSEDLLQNAQTAVAQADSAAKNFSALGEKTRAFQRATAAAQSACVTAEVDEAAPVRSPERSHGEALGNLPANRDSGVSGELKESNLPKGEPKAKSEGHDASPESRATADIIASKETSQLSGVASGVSAPTGQAANQPSMGSQGAPEGANSSPANAAPDAESARFKNKALKNMLSEAMGIQDSGSGVALPNSAAAHSPQAAIGKNGYEAMVKSAAAIKEGMAPMDEQDLFDRIHRVLRFRGSQ